MTTFEEDLGIALILFFGGFIPVLPDPFHKKEQNVGLWEWLVKEIYEEIYGEQ